MHQLSPFAARVLRDFAESGDGSWVYPVVDGEVELVCDTLPGRGVVAAHRSGPVLTIIVDTSKPAAREHLRQLVQNWPLGRAEDETLNSVATALPVRLDDGDSALITESTRNTAG